MPRNAARSEHVKSTARQAAVRKLPRQSRQLTPVEFDLFVNKEREKFGKIISHLGLQKE
jgi:hypothetical protein